MADIVTRDAPIPTPLRQLSCNGLSCLHQQRLCALSQLAKSLICKLPIKTGPGSRFRVRVWQPAAPGAGLGLVELQNQAPQQPLMLSWCKLPELRARAMY